LAFKRSKAKKKAGKSLLDKHTKEERSQIHGLNKERKLTNSFKRQLLPKHKAN